MTPSKAPVFPRIEDSAAFKGSPADADLSHVWHPFTQTLEWRDHEPLMLVEGCGARLQDSQGRWFLDGNSSIWTNLHGHRHPRLDAALKAQIDRVAHTSFLGFSNPLAARLCAELAALWPAGTLSRVFLSDNGSTAIEVALKMAAQFWLLSGQPERSRFVAFQGAYHGDTMGASALGGIPLFHERFATWQFPIERVADFDELQQLPAATIAAVVIEPLVQGANQVFVWPKGLLANVRAWCDLNGVFLIADEVLTGFGRTGTLFACEQEGVVPDFVALAKGLTGGYLPLAATLTRESIFDAFTGGADHTLYYGHSYCGNPLGCALALENLAIFREENVLSRLNTALIPAFHSALERHLAPLPEVHEIRKCGMIAGIEVRGPGGRPFEPGLRMGSRICLLARDFGLLTRPIRDTLVLMPPFCASKTDLEEMVGALGEAIRVCASKPVILAPQASGMNSGGG